MEIHNHKPWEPVLFATVTVPDWATLPTLLDNTERWLYELRNATKCHLDAVVGYEDRPNLHTHIIPLVPENELERFWARLPRFQAKCQGWWRQDVRPFDLTLRDQAWSYVQQKHTPIKFGTLCPGTAWQCRKGRCPH